MAVSAAKMKANHKYDAKTYDRVTLRIKKQDMERIKTQLEGQSINGFMVGAILEKVAALEQTTK